MNAYFYFAPVFIYFSINSTIFFSFLHFTFHCTIHLKYVVSRVFSFLFFPCKKLAIQYFVIYINVHLFLVFS